MHSLRCSKTIFHHRTRSRGPQPVIWADPNRPPECGFYKTPQVHAYYLKSIGRRHLFSLRIFSYEYLHATLETHCTRLVQSSRVGCSRRGHKIVYLAVKKGNIFVIILLLKTFFAYYYYLYNQLYICLINTTLYLCKIQRMSYVKNVIFS